MLAIVARLWHKELGIIYILLDANGKIHTITSERYLYSLRARIINYRVELVRKYIDKQSRLYTNIKLSTDDYFDTRDITYELYFARVGTMLSVGNPKAYVIKYETKKWLEQDTEQYRGSQFLMSEAKKYLSDHRNKAHYSN